MSDETQPTWHEHLAEHDNARKCLATAVFAEAQNSALPADIKAHVLMSAAAAYLTDHQDGNITLPLRRVFNAVNHVLDDALQSKLCVHLTDEEGKPTGIPEGLGS